jgi:subfamily B ATP-binding cassette protein MsbA
VALVGRSGAGKSTLVSLIPRFYDASSGEILLDGRPLADYDLRSLRDQIALVTQQVVLFNDTLERNIAYGRLADSSTEAVWSAVVRAHADGFIEALPDGLQTVVGDDGVLLSGGQRQRVAIARALLKDAPILILDEATSSLDAESEKYIQAALEEVMRGRTTLVIAHRLSTIEYSDLIVVVDGGRIVERGTHVELLARGGTYAELYSAQFAQRVQSVPRATVPPPAVPLRPG